MFQDVKDGRVKNRKQAATPIRQKKAGASEKQRPKVRGVMVFTNSIKFRRRNTQILAKKQVK
jgi:hypothetical protein